MTNWKVRHVQAGFVLAILFALFSSGLALAQGVGGYAPGVNPSNPQDLTNRGNPQSLIVPGASNPQDLVRQPSLPRAVSPTNPTNLGTAAPLVGPSLRHTHIDQPIDQRDDKPAKKFARHKRHGTTTENN